MNTRKYLIKNSLVACLVGCCVSLASAGNPPFFTTDAVLNAKGELLMTQKGTRHLDIFSADGKSLLHSFPFDEIPTGLLPDGDKVYVTTFEKTGRLQVLSLESGRVEAAIPTGSGACHPMFGPDKKHIYVCNQFDNSVVEIDPVMRKVVRSVKVLREPKSAVFSKDGKYMFVTNNLRVKRRLYQRLLVRRKLSRLLHGFLAAIHTLSRGLGHCLPRPVSVCREKI